MRDDFFKIYCYLTAIVNITSAALGVGYFIFPIFNPLWEIFGIIMLSSWFINFGLVYLNNLYIDKTNEIGKKINRFGYIFLIFISWAMIFMEANTITLSISYEMDFNTLLFSYSCLFISFFGMHAFGIIYSYLDVKNLTNREVWSNE